MSGQEKEEEGVGSHQHSSSTYNHGLAGMEMGRREREKAIFDLAEWAHFKRQTDKIVLA